MVRPMVVAATLAVLVLVGKVAEAQDLARFFIVPKIGDGQTPNTAFRPKYFDGLTDANGQPVRWQGRDYGMEAVYLVAADVSAAQATTIGSNVDVIAIPQGIDNAISLTALNTVQTRLEQLRIPAGWVTTSHTYRDVLRVVHKVFQLFGRFWVREGKTIFEAGITLDTRMNQLTQAQRNALEQAILSLNVNDTSWIAGSTTLRQVFKGVADRLPTASMMGEQF